MSSNLISLLQPIQIQFLSAISIAKLAMLSAIHHCFYKLLKTQRMLNSILWEFKGQILHYDELTVINVQIIVNKPFRILWTIKTNQLTSLHRNQNVVHNCSYQARYMLLLVIYINCSLFNFAFKEITFDISHVHLYQ